MANNTSDDELRAFVLENISHESAGCTYSELTNIARTSMDRLVDDTLLPVIKQREEQVAEQAVLAESKKLMAIPGATVDAWAPLAHDHIASRITQLTTTHKGDQ